MLKSLKLYNFKLFKSEEFSFGKINIITGENKDDSSNSSNGSGKSSILEALIFSLYGEGSGKNLADLVNFNSKSCEVELQDDTYKVIRNVPTKLSVYKNEEEIQFNINTLKQNYLDKVFGSYDFFKKYRLLNRQSVNLLDMGLTSLRKELMSFIDSDFSEIRNNLLAQKLEREKFSKSNKPYSYYLSSNRKTILSNGQYQRQGILSQTKQEYSNQEEIVNKLKIEINTLQKEIELTTQQTNKNQQQIANLKSQITSYEFKIKELNKISSPTIVNYDAQIESDEKAIKIHEAELEKMTRIVEELKKQESNSKVVLSNLITSLTTLETDIIQFKKELKQFDVPNTQKICDRCGSILSDEKQISYKKDLDEKLNKALNEKRELTDKYKTEETEFTKVTNALNRGIEEQANFQGSINAFRTRIKDLTTKKDIQNEKKELAASKDAEIQKNKELIQNTNSQIQELSKTDYIHLIAELQKKKSQLEIEVETEISALTHYNSVVSFAEKKLNRTQLFISKYNEAEKFANYKYSKEDIELYSASIKVLDDFSSWYIQQWLDSLTVIINELLEKVNLKVIFSADKQFLTIVNQEQEMKYESLSSGQQTFLNIIFKIAIMLNNGISTGLLVVDEGVGNLDLVNLHKLIDILKTTNFQTFLVYQNINEIEDVNLIEIIRENNESRKK
jgi:DNA repair exonuclease SbcCD ATPase subunit